LHLVEIKEESVVTVLLGVLVALGAAFCWAIIPIFDRFGLRDTPTLLVIAIRLSIGGLFSLVFAILSEDFLGQRPFDPVQVGFLIGITILSLGVGDWFYLNGLKMTEVSFVIGIVNIYPLFVILFSILFKTEKITPLVVLASILLVSGVTLISTTRKTKEPQLESQVASTSEPTTKIYGKSIMFAILAAFCWAIAIFGLGYSLQYIPPLSANAIRFPVVGALLFLTFLFSSSKARIEKPSNSSLIILAFGGLLGLGIGGWLMLNSIELLGSARSSGILSINPFFSAIIAMVALKEKPTLNRLSGILLVCFGVLLTSVSF